MNNQNYKMHNHSFIYNQKSEESMNRTAIESTGGLDSSVPSNQIKSKKIMLSVLKSIISYIKYMLYLYNWMNEQFLSSVFYKVLTKTTQPAHLVALLIASFVLCVLWPNLVSSPPEENIRDDEDLKLSRRYMILMYLGVFATHFGAQMWMTFVSGLSLYFNLPRHIFGQCQQILFPRYFTLNSILSLITLITFIKAHDSQWILSSYVQAIALTLCAVIELTVRLYLAPPMLHLLQQKYSLETEEGVGNEVGHFEYHGLLQKSKKFKEIHTQFRMYHTIIAVGNLLTVVCTFVHLHYLASKIVAI